MNIFNKKVVVQVVQHLRAGGIECLVLEMIRSSQLDHDEDMHIISLEGCMDDALNDWPRLLSYKNKLHFINKQPGLSISCLLMIRKLLSSLGADAVHTHHIGPLLYGGLAARLANVAQVIHTEHDAWHMQNSKRRMLESFVLACVRPILIADANGVQQQLIKYQPNYPSQIIHNGVDCKIFNLGNKVDARDSLKLPSIDKKLIGCSGRLTEVKGHKYLIDALKYLQDDCILVLAGDGEYKKELKKYVELSNLNNRVIFLGNLDCMQHFYQSLDVFCMASLNEGLPLSPLEAQACGIPVVLTDVGGCKEACCPDSGIMVSAKDSAALAWGIRKLLRSLIRNEVVSPRSFVCKERNFLTMLSKYRMHYKGIH